MLTPADEQSADPIAALAPAPTTALDAAGIPRYGGYEGVVASASIAGVTGTHRLGGADPWSIARRALRQKSWVYLFAATTEVSVAAVLVNGAVTGTGFLMVTDLHTGEVIADSSRKGALARVNDNPGEGLRAGYRLPGTRYAVRRSGDEVRFRASLGRSVAALPGRSRPWLEADLALRSNGAGITAISEVDHGGQSAAAVTAKTAGLPVSGQVVVHGDGPPRTVSLEGGFGGYDYTKGLLPRTTAWRWAYGTGRLADGTVLGFNLVEGFSGIGERSRENAVWIDGRPRALDPRTRFDFDPSDVMRPWRITTVDGTVRLRFDPVAAHSEHLDLKVLRSRFVQPVGHYSGEIDVDGRTHVLEGLPGVAEDQDILW